MEDDMADRLHVGDQVFRREIGSVYGPRDVRKLHTIVRATHNGQRLVTDTGLVIVASSETLLGDGPWSRTIFARYSEEVQAAWDAADRRKAVDARLYALLEHGYKSLRERYPVEALERIATMLEEELAGEQERQANEKRAFDARYGLLKEV
jgi:hypothetical protein